MSDDSATGQPPLTPDPSADRTSAAPPAPAGPTCPWCSAALDTPMPRRCPACGAGLVEDPETSIPGVTTLDPALLRVAKSAAAQPQKRGFFRPRLDPARETDVADLGPPSLDALAPPSRAVLEEMHRLRVELDEAAAAEAAAALAQLVAARPPAAVDAAEAHIAEADDGVGVAPAAGLPGAQATGEDPADPRA